MYLTNLRNQMIHQRNMSHPEYLITACGIWLPWPLSTHWYESKEPPQMGRDGVNMKRCLRCPKDTPDA